MWEEDYPVPPADLLEPPLPRHSRRQITEFMRDTITFNRFSRQEFTQMPTRIQSTNEVKPFTVGPSAQHRIFNDRACVHVSAHLARWAFRQLRLQFARRLLGGGAGRHRFLHCEY